MRSRILLPILLAPLALGWYVSSPLKYPVNMTLADERLYVSDRYNGVHVFDVTDPETPQPAFVIPLVGNRGTAVKGDIIYANERDRLLVIRIEGNTYEVVKEIEPTYPSGGGEIPWLEGPLHRQNRGFGCNCINSTDLGARSSSSPSTGSSYATFAVIDDFLYYLDYTSIVTLDITEPENPKELSRTRIGWTVETIYPTNDFLFIGGTRGMYVFDRNDPAKPKEIGRVEHFRACDPVVVSGPVAYVTLRGGNACGESRDVLLCVSVEDPSHPLIISEKELETPYGLVARDPFLYVSSGKGGFKLLDVANPEEPEVVDEWTDWPTKDFIWSGDILFVLGFENLLIFDVSTPSNPALLATIEPETS
jgi:hypothetical protein